MMCPKIRIWSATLGKEVTFHAIRKHKLMLQGRHTISRVAYDINTAYNLAKNDTWYCDFATYAMRRVDGDRPPTSHAKRKLADIEDDVQRWWKTLDRKDLASLHLSQSNWEANDLRMTLADLDQRHDELERLKAAAGQRLDVLIQRYPHFKDTGRPFEIDDLFSEIEREVAAHNM